MNLTVEKSLTDWLKSLAEFAGLYIHAGQTDEEIPNDYPVIYVIAAETDSPANTLYVSPVQIIVSTPEIIEDSFQTHADLVAKLKAAIKTADNFTGFFPQDAQCVGAELNKWNDQQDDGRWTTSAELTLGVIEI
jgi:hypothetical protein